MRRLRYRLCLVVILLLPCAFLIISGDTLAKNDNPEWFTNNIQSEADVPYPSDEEVWGTIEQSVETNVLGSGDSADVSFGAGIMLILGVILNILTVGVVIAGITGVIFFAIMWIRSNGNIETISEAKRKLGQIVVGLVIWSIFYAALSWLLPNLTGSEQLMSEEQKQEVFNNHKEAIYQERLAYYRKHAIWDQDEKGHWRVRDKDAYFENDILDAGGDTGGYDVAHDAWERNKTTTSKTDYLIILDEPQLYATVLKKNPNSANNNDKWLPVRGFNFTDHVCPRNGSIVDGIINDHDYGFPTTSFSYGVFHPRPDSQMGHHGITSKGIAPSSQINCEWIYNNIPIGTRILSITDGPCK